MAAPGVPAIRRGVGSGEAKLAALAAELRYVGTGVPVTRELLQKLGATARPLAPMVRSAIMNIPSAGGIPYGQPPGLRARIASTVIPWAKIEGDIVQVGVEVQPMYMPDGQKALPLYMDGVKPNWRHPLFGNADRWYDQQVPAGSGINSHPFFAQATYWYGPAARNAIDRALDEITRLLEIA